MVLIQMNRGKLLLHNLTKRLFLIDTKKSYNSIVQRCKKIGIDRFTREGWQPFGQFVTKELELSDIQVCSTSYSSSINLIRSSERDRALPSLVLNTLPELLRGAPTVCSIDWSEKLTRNEKSRWLQPKRGIPVFKKWNAHFRTFQRAIITRGVCRKFQSENRVVPSAEKTNMKRGRWFYVGVVAE